MTMTDAPLVLVVDDDPDIAEPAADMLRAEGFRALMALDITAALLMIDKHKIDLVFTDIVMPKIDGIMLADMIKTSKPEIGILYGTGHGDRIKTLPGVLHGPMLTKPYNAASLAKGVRDAIALNALRAAKPG